ncbi:MAG: 2-phosphosulfolactate phosphatase [Bacteroidales bacterium]|nr:2-phosphosulfolactate phosphatase [Bacteroidales bacterium]
MIYAIATANEATSYDFNNHTAVVIDVLRATTTMSVALHNKASQIIAVRTPEEALDIRTRLGNDILLGGERNADKIDGFDLDNSPRSYTSDVVANKTIVMTTTNGTQAINSCQSAKHILIASFPNVVNTLSVLGEILCNEPSSDVYLICSGTEGRFTIEDGLCAGLIIHHLEGEKSDFAIALEQLYLSSFNNTKVPSILSSDTTAETFCQINSLLKNVTSRGEHFKRLRRKGYEADIDICFNISLHHNAIECKNGRIYSIN